MLRLLLIALLSFASTITIAQQVTQDLDALLAQNKNTLGLSKNTNSGRATVQGNEVIGLA